jgi:hypothetical protein
MSEDESPKKKLAADKVYRIPKYSDAEVKARRKAEADAVELARVRYAKKLIDDNWHKFFLSFDKDEVIYS